MFVIIVLLTTETYLGPSLREKCPYSELFWSFFSCIWTEYGKIVRISPYSVRMRENMDQNNSEYGHLLRSACQTSMIEFLPKIVNGFQPEKKSIKDV